MILQTILWKIRRQYSIFERSLASRKGPRTISRSWVRTMKDYARDLESPVSEAGSVPQMLQPTISPPRHDAFWGHMYLLAFAAMCTTWFLVFHHAAPRKTD